MNCLIALWKELANDCASMCDTVTTRDVEYVTRRFEHEGLSFLTITLPDFGKSFERSLDTGQVDRSLFTSTSWKGGLPRFLGGFLDQVFDRNDGTILHDPSIAAIRAIRQLTLMFGKYNAPCSPSRERAAFRRFVETDKDVGEGWERITKSQKDDFVRISRLLYRHLLLDLDQKIWQAPLKPKHGPGATAERVSGNRKFDSLSWTERLEEVFHFGDYLIPSHRFSERYDRVDIKSPGEEIPVRVVSVPKTLKTPRIIGIEPVCMQYMQQAVKDSLIELIERDDILSVMLGFDDQTPNQRMALEGSRSGDLATLDLSDASDRVANELVKLLFEPRTLTGRAVQATRSTNACVNKEVVHLSKFASMGSALCFPVEAMVFLTVIFIGIEKCHGSRLTRKGIKSFLGRVRVYGDDIIVPADYVSSVVDALHSFNFVVNHAKSFWTGKFRESCGKEYYAGHDVSLVRVRRGLVSRQRRADELESTVALRNQLYWAGYWATCRFLDEYIKERIHYFPVVLPTSPVLGRHSVLGFETQRIGRNLHDPQVKGFVRSSLSPPDILDGEGALLKCFLKDMPPPGADKNHLLRAGRPLKKDDRTVVRWASAV